ncbi:MAG: hypothetical protein R2939_15680 [Kofleriaceae bacterium]
MQLAAYREKAAFAQFGSDLDKATLQQLRRGERMTELLKQGQYSPLSMEEQVVVLYAGMNGFIDELPLADLGRYEKELLSFIKGRKPELLEGMRTTGALAGDAEASLKDALAEFGKQFATTKA